MEVTALHIRLFVLLLVAEVDFSYSQKAGFPQVFPDSQQHFQYENIVVSCEGLEGLTGWRVMKKVKGVNQICAPSWSTSTGPCTIQNVYPADSGEYWCEMGGKKSETVNISVTAASVILEIPVRPAMEGDAVTLRCRMKSASSNLTADFFKDGYQMESSSAGNLSFSSVSTSNEGSYRCRISGGESAQSWLRVRAADEEAPRVLQLPLLLSVGLGVCLFLVLLLLLLLVRLLRWRKQQTSANPTDDRFTSADFQPSTFPQTVSRQVSVSVPIDATYAVVTKAMMEQSY